MSKEKDDNYWRDKLTPEEFHVCREAGTERPFSGEYWDCFEDGTYRCRCCGEPLFHSDSKFDAGCGWPSFDTEVAAGVVAERPDNSLGMQRIEILCAKCNSHLGHVFPDGPTETGLRYCVNSLSVKLDQDESASQSGDESIKKEEE
ncbi:peptide-methionine (R)-S-oxide reductase [Microbulbifer flavimaris]|uniref:Peptide methionine sulfoxide reductase MsrB n=1 Tax=Microbulbifer flavimaris TaxID=1781068 RepID=A0ABX4HVH6_9GAMM|nr:MULTISPECIES: peptide-methionine (R)-S-oxide reductase MsrB [Microbulbifer]KUJ79186.1 methionine sulfoxide reductase B [Microbulbifer sp. ZGT114]PCO04109.1 peptide-methionine (R)-S-oxide reductase [Microbulbifer flavimaris]